MNWSLMGNSYYATPGAKVDNVLQKGIYILEFDTHKQCFYLEKIANRFVFDYKIYGKDSKFIQTIIKTWENTTGSLGVLLNGVRGTGKTVTAELVANSLELPVILITKSYNAGVPEFLASIGTDFICFIDEYEKVFTKKENASLLSIMDGVLTTENRICFLLTTNSLSVEENLLQRPSRIRYIKQYSDLELDVIKEVIDDCLVHKEHYAEVLKYVSELSIITIDIVKTIIEEVNIHNVPPSEFKSYLNVDEEERDPEYAVYRLDPITGKEELISGFTACYHAEEYLFEEYIESHYNYPRGETFKVGSNIRGRVECIISENSILVTEKKPLFEEGKIKLDEDGRIVNADLQVVYRFEKSKRLHASFRNVSMVNAYADGANTNT